MDSSTTSGAGAAVVIVGGGLSGLVAAWLLHQHGVTDVVLLEARSVPGGRIQSIDASATVVDPAQAATDRFDLGPTWFWPDVQPQLDGLVQQLGLRSFDSFEEGDMLLERAASGSARGPATRVRGYASEPTSARLVGGTGALVAALCQRLPPGVVRTGHTVHRIGQVSDAIELHVESASGVGTLRAQHLLLALPPRLAEFRITFDPPLPAELARTWRATPTWMAPHAKYVAVFDTPFWREQGLSGAARSQQGPMAEIHDVSMPGGHAALFGFLGIAAQVRRDVGDDVLRAHCREQLGRIFGPRAAAPVADALKDWATDPLTATQDDQRADGHHAVAPPRSAEKGPWQGRLTGIGSEWSPQFPGYLAGAVDAATRGVHHWLAACRKNSDTQR